MIRDIGFERLAAPDKTFVTIDHTTNHHDLATLEEHRFIREDCKSEGVRWFLALGANGISHNAALEVGAVKPGMLVRAEEHTSELRSLMRTSSAVFCLKTTLVRNVSLLS